MNSAQTIFRNIAIFIVFVIPFISLAAPLYQPGETLNPACLPTDADCTVATSTSSTSFSTTTNDYWLTQQFSLSNLAGIGSSTGTTFLNGNVGIGTSTSGQYNLLLARATGSATANIQTSDAAGEAAINLENSVRRWKIKATAAASDAFVIRDQTAAADRFVINSVGNIGIGTTSAYAKLSVGSTDTASTTFALRPIASQTGNILDIYNTSGALTSVITAAGNWGIGTSSPAVRLQIGSGYANFDNSYGLTFANAGATDRDIARILYSPSGTLDFYNADAVRMTVGYGGNIGIGTTSPYTKLSVVGDIVATAITATSSFNTSGTTGGYKIDGNLILQASSTNFSTLVGRSAGNALLADGVANTALGYQALITATSSDYNTAVGHSALYANTTGSYNTANGYRALYSNTTGVNNAANGSYSLYTNTTGASNTANGYASLYSNTTGSNNVANGNVSLYSNTTGSNNSASGFFSLYYNTTGSQNIAVGRGALQANTTGSNNTATGYTSLYSNITGGQNTADGNSSLRYGSTTSGVTAIGYIAGVGPSNIASDYNSLADTNMTFLGASASRDNNNASTTILTNSTAIGYNAKVGGSNMMVLGNSVNVGIGTSSPLAKLDVLNTAGGSTALFSIASSTSGAATSTAFYVAANGNIAIGTTTANSKLQISGDVSTNPTTGVYGQLEVTGTDPRKRLSMGFNTTSNYAFIQSLVSGDNYYNLILNPNGASAGNVGISTTTPYAKLSVTNTGTGPSFVVEDSASADTTPFIVDASGNVGMGITVPTRALHVYSPSANIALFDGASPSVTSVAVSNSSTGGRIWQLMAAGQTPTGGDIAKLPTGAFSIYDGTSGLNRMVVNSSGNVGIGTTTPNYKLDVNGGSTASQLHFTSDGADSGGYLVSAAANNFFMSAGAAFNGSSWIAKSTDASIIGGGGGGIPTGSLSFLTNTGLTSGASYTPTTRMVVTGTGDVGIGTTTPSSRLSVTQSANTSAGGLWIAETGNTDFRSIYMATDGTMSFYGGDTSGALNTATLNSSGAWTNASDKSYKENIVDLGTKYGLATVLQTQPRFYEMKGTHLPQVGFIAQELNELVPEVVDGKDGSMGISYGNLVAVAFQAIKELSAKVDGLVANGLSAVKTLFVDDLEVKNKFTVSGEVCVDDICVTKEQFKKMLQKAGGEEKPKENNKPKEETPKPQENATTTATTTPEVVTPPVATSTPEVIKEEPKEEVKEETASTTPETVVEEPKKEEEKPIVEAPKVEEPKPEETPKVEEPPKEEVKEEIKPVEEPKKEEPKVEEEKKEEPKSEETPQS